MEIIIKVYDYKNPGCQRKEKYRNTIMYDNSLVFPFNQLYDTFSLLYPDCMIEFTMHLNR